MPDIVITDINGVAHRFPEGTSLDEANAAVGEELKRNPKVRSLADRITEPVRPALVNLGSGLLKTLTSLAEGASNISSDRPKPETDVNPVQDIETIRRKLKGGKDSDVTRALETAGGGLIPVPGASASSLLAGAGGSAAGQYIAAKMGVPEPIGAIVGGVGGGLASIPSGATNNRALDIVKSQGEEGLQAARAKANQTSSMLGGAPVLLNQGLEGKGIASSILDSMATSPARRAELDEILRQQDVPTQAMLKAFVENSGAQGSGVGTTNSITEAIAGALQRLRDLPNQMSRSAFDRAEGNQLSTAQRFDLSSELGKVPDIVQVLEKSAAGKAALGVGDAATNPSSILQQNGKPFTLADPSVIKLDNLRKEAEAQGMSQLGPAASGGDVAQARGMTAVADTLRQATREASPALKEGYDIQRIIRNAVVDPGEKGVLGKVAGAKLSQVDQVAGAQNRFLQVLDKPSEFSPGDVRKFAYDLHQSDPEAFGNVIRSSLEKRLETAIDASNKGPADFTSAAEKIFGGPTSKLRQNLEAAVGVKAQIEGKSKDEAIDALRKVYDTLATVGQGRVGQGSADVGSGIGRGSAGQSLSHPQTAMGVMVDKLITRKVYENLLADFSAPDSASRLIARAQVAREAPNRFLQGLISTSGSTANSVRQATTPKEGN